MTSDKVRVVELIGGPQDGAKVSALSPQVPLPDTLYVGPKWLGDGFAAWSDERSDRFPCRYEESSGDTYLWSPTP